MTFSILVTVGTIVLGLVIAFALLRSRQFKNNATTGELAARDQATRENFNKVETNPDTRH
jgi:hypothetical protein